MIQNHDIDLAVLMFDSMPERNLVSWNSMLAAYAHQGHLRELQREIDSLVCDFSLEGVKPDEATFHSGIVGCNHAGMVRECCKCFKLMNLEHGISPQKEHFCVVVDVLCKSGQLNHAQDLLQNMPFVPDSAVKTAFLCAAGVHHAIRTKNLDVDHHDSGSWLALANSF
ncbi:hypothetical protein SELMODRAFT_134893 [Selaginella moellendorffii]|uniref:Pentacotripeptide-repeat region of PRORP domain-containing protein n=2 Tax=Selaginella moellendorffii TaxID=88036 RepID=D8T9F2_SELML|nr:hypothetical protein SELMODRAFT_134893 [Selaginella moellendorffii]